MQRRRTLTMVAGGLVGLGLTFGSPLLASDALPPPKQEWSHSGMLDGFDHAAVRRGYQVYKNVCSSCHSLQGIAYRNLVGVVGTEEEVKEWAAEVEVQNEDPNDDGEYFERPGKLTDKLPAPYPNKEAAKAANQGAVPPDLTLMKKARVGGEDYIYALLTGYRELPEGVEAKPGLYYNPYFPGAWIGMKPPISDGAVDYDDGTEATLEQMARDVSTFLSWTAEPEHDLRKQTGLKSLIILGLMLLPTIYFKRWKWTVIKNRQIRFTK